MSDRIQDIEARFHQSLSGLAMKWSTFAEDVRDGYRLAVYNYMNSLTIRDMLEEAMSALGDADRRWLMDLVEPSDAVFMHATREDPEHLLSRLMLHGSQWWWNRVPILLGSLAGDYGIYPRGDSRRTNNGDSNAQRFEDDADDTQRA